MIRRKVQIMPIEVCVFALAGGLAGCFGRLNLPTPDQLRPTLAKAFTLAQHGRALSPKDVEVLKRELPIDKLRLFEELMAHLNSPCSDADLRCGEEKIQTLGALYERWSAIDTGFDAQLVTASALFFLGQSAKNANFRSSIAEPLLHAGEDRIDDLMKRFPGKAMVYGQRAFMHTFNQNERALVRKNILKCLELDPATEWCRKLARRY